MAQFPLGTVIAERQIRLHNKEGEEQTVTVRLGAPVSVRFPDDLSDESDAEGMRVIRCPLQIIGLDMDERVFPIAGENGFVAL